MKYNGELIAPATQVVGYEENEELIGYIIAGSQFGAAFAVEAMGWTESLW